ncbi:hypothetical protein [Xylophilus sp.]|uniref:hypothetical protein n=1 Tax=Xylophilus sp. TaxID=2653893 RepID=UPI002D802010|nr:hypothetical protein [Xylophilus sp.]
MTRASATRGRGLTHDEKDAFDNILSSALAGRAGPPRQTTWPAARFLAPPNADFITGQLLLMDGGIVLACGRFTVRRWPARA